MGECDSLKSRRTSRSYRSCCDIRFRPKRTFDRPIRKRKLSDAQSKLRSIRLWVPLSQTDKQPHNRQVRQVSKRKLRSIANFPRRIHFSPIDLQRATSLSFLCAFHSIDARWRDQMKTQCLLKRNKYHTTAWMDAEATKLGLLVQIPELGGLWEIVEIYPYRLTDKQLRTHKTLIALL